MENGEIFNTNQRPPEAGYPVGAAASKRLGGRSRMIFDIAVFSGIATMTGFPRYVTEVLRRLLRRGDLDVTTICSLPEEDSAYRNFKRFFSDELPFQGQKVEHYVPPEHSCTERRSRLKRIEDAFKNRFPDSRLLASASDLLRRIKWAVSKPAFLTERPRSPFFERLVRESDIYFSPFHPLIPELSENPSIRTALVVHDLIPIVLADLYKGHRFFQKNPWETVTSETLIFTDSESTRRDLLHYCPSIHESRVTTVLLAADERFRPCEDREKVGRALVRYGIVPGLPYVLSVATMEIRKNFDHVMRCFAKLIERHGETLPDLRLVLTGAGGWEDRKFRSVFTGLSKKVRDRIVFTGYVDDEDLPLLYAGAACFCYMSLYEGFGLPPLEAMACGAPVVAADNSSLPEVVGDAGILLDAKDEESLVEAFRTVLTDESLRRTMVEKGLRRAKSFSWDRCVEETFGKIVDESTSVVRVDCAGSLKSDQRER